MKTKQKEDRDVPFKKVIEAGIKNAFKLGSPGSNTSDVNEVKYNSVPVYLQKRNSDIPFEDATATAKA